MSDIITLADFKTYAREEGATNDLIFTMLISVASEAIQRFLNRAIIEATYTAIELTGAGGTILHLPNWPTTTTGLVVEEDGVTLTEGEDEDFRLHGTEDDKGWLEKLAGTWSKGINKIILTYKAGYTIANVPKDLQYAAMHKAARMWKEQRAQSWGESSRSFPDGSISTVEADLFDKEEIGILQRYRRLRI